MGFINNYFKNLKPEFWPYWLILALYIGFTGGVVLFSMTMKWTEYHATEMECYCPNQVNP